MANAQLTWSDSGELLDGLDEFAQLLDRLGIQYGSVSFASNGDICGTFTTEDNTLHAGISKDGRKKTVDYER